MIVHAKGKVIATDTEGNTQPIGVTGVAFIQDELKVSGQEEESLLLKILKELKINNIHMSLLTDVNIRNNDVEV